jgi:hypothetical protein
VRNNVATGVSTGRSACGRARQGRQGRWLASRRRKKGAARGATPFWCRTFGTSFTILRGMGAGKNAEWLDGMVRGPCCFAGKDMPRWWVDEQNCGDTRRHHASPATILHMDSGPASTVVFQLRKKRRRAVVEADTARRNAICLYLISQNCLTATWLCGVAKTVKSWAPKRPIPYNPFHRLHSI